MMNLLTINPGSSATVQSDLVRKLYMHQWYFFHGPKFLPIVPVQRIILPLPCWCLKRRCCLCLFNTYPLFQQCYPSSVLHVSSLYKTFVLNFPQCSLFSLWIFDKGVFDTGETHWANSLRWRCSVLCDTFGNLVHLRCFPLGNMSLFTASRLIRSIKLRVITLECTLSAF